MSTSPTWQAEADIVIAGGGTAGCVVAHRLSEDPGVQVLLLEAGGEDSHPLVRMPAAFIKATQRPEFNWGYVSEPEAALNGRRIPLPRGRLLGGSSSINGMFHIRGHAKDFDDWAALGLPGWSYAEVLPYFLRSERHALGPSAWHGDAGPMQVRPIDTRHLLAEPLHAAAHAAGHRANPDYDGEHHDGVAPGMVNVDARGRRHSTARAYLHPARQRPNLRVMTGVQAERVLFSEGRACGVQARQGGRALQVRARREVLLCGGAYGSPQMLMLSGIGPGAHLQELGIAVVADAPAVGENLIEHPRLPLQFNTRRPISFLNQLRFDRAALSALRWALWGSGPFATQVSSGTVLFKTRPELDRPDIQLLCNPVRLDARLWFPGLAPRQRDAFYITLCQLYAKSRGRVRLRSAQAADAPRVWLNLFTHEDDRANMRAALREARRIYATEPLASLLAEETLPGAALRSDDEIDQAITEFGGITHHPVGTCAMGTVLDAQLRVRGVQGLRVVDASVMPSIVGGNTHAATVMIAEKAADLIRGRQLPAATLPHAA